MRGAEKKAVLASIRGNNYRLVSQGQTTWHLAAEISAKIAENTGWKKI
jgi:hypothetical protein